VTLLANALVIAGFLFAAEPVEPPRIGLIEFYGLRSLPVEKVRQVLRVSEGDPLPRSKEEAELAIEKLERVQAARLQATCCEEGKAILYVGVLEKGQPSPRFREEPRGLVLLPEEVHDAYVRFLAAIYDASQQQNLAEDLTAGHSLLSHPRARAQQEKFIELADRYLRVLRDVLRNSYDAEHRAIAAYVLGYVKDKKQVVPDLLYALTDPDETVRDNALRSLAAIALLAVRKPETGILIDASPLIDLLDSAVWTDRTNAAIGLANLTENRPEELLRQLRQRALLPLVEMARWRHLPHALPAFILLGRMLGMEENAIQHAWTDPAARADLINRAAGLGAAQNKRP